MVVLADSIFPLDWSVKEDAMVEEIGSRVRKELAKESGFNINGYKAAAFFATQFQASNLATRQSVKVAMKSVGLPRRKIAQYNRKTYRFIKSPMYLKALLTSFRPILFVNTEAKSKPKTKDKSICTL